jgi:hypothetical protein
VEVYACDGQYFDGYCRLREDKRTFRLDRIVTLELLDETFDVDPVIDGLVRKDGWTNRTHEWRRRRAGELAKDEQPSFDRPEPDIGPNPQPTGNAKLPGCLSVLLSILAFGIWR